MEELKLGNWRIRAENQGVTLGYGGELTPAQCVFYFTPENVEKLNAWLTQWLKESLEEGSEDTGPMSGELTCKEMAEIMNQKVQAKWGSLRNWQSMPNDKKIATVPDRFIAFSFGACLLCDTPITELRHTYHTKGLCESCAEVIAEIYFHDHTGEWVFWPRENAQGISSKLKKRPLPQGLRTKVFERDKYRCVCCGTHKQLSVDHVYPEVHGGSDEFDNLQTLCKPCNSKKGDALPE